MLDGYKEYTLYRNGGHLCIFICMYFPIWEGDLCPRQASLAPDTVTQDYRLEQKKPVRLGLHSMSVSGFSR